MPAEIYTEDKMFYLRADGAPWHGLGTAVEEAPDSAAAIQLAGLDWTVRTVPAVAPHPLGPALPGEPPRPLYVTSPDLVAIQREDNGFILGHATDRYEPVQNREAFEWADGLLADDVLRYSTAGSLRHGRTVWLLAQFNEGFEIAGEQWQRYLALTTDHSGSGSLAATLTSVRIVCANTLDAAFAGGAKIRLRHTKSIHDRLAEAQRVMQITTGQQRRMQSMLAQAAVTAVRSGLVDDVVRDIFGEPADRSGRAKAGAERFRSIVGAEFVRNGQTAYSLVNGITGYADHVRSGDGTKDQARNERRFEAVTFGGGSTFKGALVKKVLVEAGVSGR